jgi:hypothetical protein
MRLTPLACLSCIDSLKLNTVSRPLPLRFSGVIVKSDRHSPQKRPHLASLRFSHITKTTRPPEQANFMASTFLNCV